MLCSLSVAYYIEEERYQPQDIRNIENIEKKIAFPFVGLF